MNKFAKYVPEDDKKKQREHIGAVGTWDELGTVDTRSVTMIPNAIYEMPIYGSYKCGSRNFEYAGEYPKEGDRIHITFDGVEYDFTCINTSPFADDGDIQYMFGIADDEDYPNIVFPNEPFSISINYSSYDKCWNIYCAVPIDETENIEHRVEMVAYIRNFSEIPEEYLPKATNLNRGVISKKDIAKYDREVFRAVIGETTWSEIEDFLYNRVKKLLVSPNAFIEITDLSTGITNSFKLDGNLDSFSTMASGSSPNICCGVLKPIVYIEDPYVHARLKMLFENNGTDKILRSYKLYYPSSILLRSSSGGIQYNEKMFKITVDDNGNIKATAIEE